MQFHHHGYVSGDPRVQPAAGVGLDRPDELPDEVDVLIVGAGPAGMIAAAQLSQFPEVTTRIVDRRDGPARDRAGGRHPGAQRRDVPGVRVRRPDRRGGLPHHRDVLLAPGPRRPVAHRPRRTAARRPRRHQRVPAPHRQPGAGARLLRRVHGERTRAGWRRTTATSSAGLERSDDHVDVTLVRTRGSGPGRRRWCEPSTSWAPTVPAAGCAPRSAAPWRGTRRSTPGASWTSSPSPTSRTSASSARSSPARAAASCSSRARAATCSACTSTSGRSTPTPTTRCAARRSSRSSPRRTRSCTRTRSTCGDVAWHSVYEVGHRLTDRFDDVPVEERGHARRRASSSPATPATPTAPRPARA